MLIAMAVYDTEENGRTALTEQTIFSLLQTVDLSQHRIIIVDNASCKETKAALAYHALNGKLTVLTNTENVGTAKAVNRAWKTRRPGEHVVKMDNDVLFEWPGWADAMVECFDRDKTLGEIGLKRTDLAESPYATESRYVSHLYMLPHEKGQHWWVLELAKSIIGTCVGFSSGMLDRLGYLWQPGLYGFEDCDISERAKLAGYKIGFLCNFPIQHIDPGGNAYFTWKQRHVNPLFEVYDKTIALYKKGSLKLFRDAGV